MKKYLRVFLPAVAAMFLVVAGCSEPEPEPVDLNMTDESMTVDMPVNPEGGAPAAAEAAPAEKPAAEE